MSEEARRTADAGPAKAVRGRLKPLLAATAVACGLAAIPGAAIVIGTAAHAQVFQWPWESEVKPAPRPRPQPPPTVQDDYSGGWTERSPICVQLEQRLVQESQRGSQSRDMLPRIDDEIRQLSRTVRQGERELERKDCYEYFLFTKSIRRNRTCIRAARRSEDARRRLADLKAERQAIVSSSGQSYQDDIIRELARNNCGDSYTQEARRRNRGPFSSFWGNDDGGSGYANEFGALPFATYRTLCVRLCDGYYFPVSFSTLPNHFQRDSEVCQSKCAAPAQLYYHRNPGGSVEQMVAFGSNLPYTELKAAFSYRKEFTDGCSCKQAEYIPQTPIPGEGAPAGQPGDPAGGWRQGDVQAPAGGEQQKAQAGMPETLRDHHRR